MPLTGAGVTNNSGLGIEIPITSDSKDFIDSVSRVNNKLKELEGLAKENAALAGKISTAQTQAAKTATMSWTDFRSMYQTVLDVVRVGQQVWQATGQEFVNYAEQVKNMSRGLGASAEETSRLIQVADDVRISYSSLNVAMKMAQKDGIQPNIEGLAKLSDQYLSLAPGVERTKFLLDKFGKSGMEMGKLMEKGGDGIRKMSGAIDDGLIMTAAGIKASDDYQKSVDDLSDSWAAFAMTVGSKVVPVVGDLVNRMNDEIAATKLAKEDGKTLFWLSGEKYQAYIDEASAARELANATTEAAVATDDSADAFGTQKEALAAAKDELKNYQDALEAVSDANKDMESMSRQIAQDQKAYAKDHADAAATLSKAITEGDAEGIAKAQKDIQELEATWHESSQNMIYDMVLVGLSAGGLLDSEQKAADEYAVKAGIKTQADIDEANRRRDIADSTINGILQSEDVLTEQRKVDAETLRLQSQITAAEVMSSADQEAQAMANVSLAIDSGTRSLMAMAQAARQTAGAVSGIRMPAMLPTGISKSMADPRRGRGSNVPYALGGEFMIPMQYGNEGFNMGGMATASGGEKVTITPKGQASSGTVYNIYITNPKREAAEDSIKNALRNLNYTGSAN